MSDPLTETRQWSAVVDVAVEQERVKMETEATLIIEAQDREIVRLRGLIAAARADTAALVRYRRRSVIEGGGMVPDPEGQWVHVGDLGIEEWTLDATDRSAALEAPDD